MAVVKKKKPVSAPVKKSMPASKLKKLAQKAMVEFQAESKARHDKVLPHFKTLNDSTQDSVERITSLLVRIARKNMWVSAGKRGDRVVLPIPEETIKHNAFYMAMEIVKDLALFDVRIADYNFSTASCAECGTPLKIAKKKGKR